MINNFYKFIYELNILELKKYYFTMIYILKVFKFYFIKVKKHDYHTNKIEKLLNF